MTAAVKSVERDADVTVLEADNIVGGISRTVTRGAWRFDIGGHRFFTKVPEVEKFWHQILPSDDEFLVRPRLSRIYYNGKFFDYPLQLVKALKSLGFFETLMCGLSLMYYKVFRPKDRSTFEGWMIARFGKRLYKTFFKTYTEKVWGIPADQLQADWAAQRIKNLSITKAILHSIPFYESKEKVTSLIEEFLYPVKGPGMMWERAAELATSKGALISMDSPVVKVEVNNKLAVKVVFDSPEGEKQVLCDELISSMPLSELVRALDPKPPTDVIEAAAKLKYRDHVTVAIVVPGESSFPDNWIYVHDPRVLVGRVQNFGAWSDQMVKPGTTCLGLEYFANSSDRLWKMDEAELVDLASNEIDLLGLAKKHEIITGFVVKMSKAYPIYDPGYSDHVRTIRDYIDQNVINLQVVGRNGMHRYNNQDHSMYTAMLAVDNIYGASHDLWKVNVEEEYHEELGEIATGRSAPIVSNTGPNS